jgi:hypothetical protein
MAHPNQTDIKQAVKILKEGDSWYIHGNDTIEPCTKKYRNIYAQNYRGTNYYLFPSLRDVVRYLLNMECLRITLTEEEYLNLY